MVFFPFPLLLVSWEGLGLKTPVREFSGFFPGVEQGARIGTLEIPSLRNSLISPPILVELFLLYLLLPLPTFLDMVDSLDISDVEVIILFEGIIF